MLFCFAQFGCVTIQGEKDSTITAYVLQLFRDYVRFARMLCWSLENVS